MRVLVTGASGFVGRHAVRECISHGHSAIAMIAPGQPADIPGVEATESADLSDTAALASLIERHHPDACLHLAGIAFVPVGWSRPQDTFRVNTIGTINLLEAFRAYHPACRVLAVTSSQIYGQQPRGHLIREDDPPAPDSIYAVSKWAQDDTARLYARRYHLPVMTARPCNHIGPGQSEDFVVTAFARQLIEISTGARPPVMQVGNLASEREFTDVRDTVRAYRLLLEKGTPGQAYNVASSRLTTIQALFDQLCLIAGVHPRIEVDPARYRPTDTQPLLDCSRILGETGWKPEIPVETTLRDVIADLRTRPRPVR